MTEFSITIILIIAILLATRQIYLRRKNGTSCCGTHETAVRRVTVPTRTSRTTLTKSTCKSGE